VQRSNKNAFELLRILKRSFTKNINTRKLELKNKLDNLKYNPEVDINIFIAELQNTIDELKKIDNDIEPSIKVGILNRSLREELRRINEFQFKNDWNKCSEYFKNELPEIISSNLKESIDNNQNNKNIFSLENNININTNKKKHSKTKEFTKILKMVDVITDANGDISFMNVKIEEMIKIIIKEKKL